MDKTLEIVVAAAIVIAIGAIAAYLVNDEASSFSDFIGGETDSARCDLLQNRYQNADSAEERTEIQSNNDLEDCDVTAGTSPNNGGGGGGQ
ncbi:hypothetical protein HRED_05294 [Candidatus Haloredivivus sp. G17]|jgi:hypothetical protein|nr:hypothetical protein HRED_05294 [Candidatus Haloredivivus sp. G17]